MKSRARALAAAAVGALLAVPAPASAWPSDIMHSLARDARRLLPRSLAQLMAEREKEIFDEARMFPAEMSQALAADLSEGRLRPQTLALLDAHAKSASDMIRERRVTDGVTRLGALLRIPADLSDPVLSAGPEGYPIGVTREYYTFVAGSLDKIPVVIDDEAALKLSRRNLGGYWQGVLGRSRLDSPVIRTELFRNGRLVNHRAIDYRSPVFGVGSLAYSRAVTAIAATWLAVWRDVKGDVSRQPKAAVVEPVNAPPVTPTPVGSPEANLLPDTRGAGSTPAKRAGRGPKGGARRSAPPYTMKPRALVSVHDKEGLAELGRGLASRGFEIVSTGGTAEQLKAAGVTVVPVQDATGFPEMLDGRVKTLHPKLFGGILGRRGVASHQEALRAHGIPPIDVVVVNLYPFEQTVAKGAPFDEVVENIDVGGPSMVRAAAKNFRDVCVVVDPADYALLLGQLDRKGGPDAPTRLFFAQKAFRHSARYEAAIAAYFAQVEAKEGAYAPGAAEDSFPYRLALSFEKVQDLRYGENPHQRAAFYSDLGSTLYSVAAARKLQGKELSFNNILDLDAAWRLATELPSGGCVIVKHTNPCGTALGPTSQEAFSRAWSCDPLSAFGGIIAFNRRVDAAAARAVADVFVEAVIAPGYEGEAKKILSAKKNLRVMDMDTTSIQRVAGFDMRRVMGGLLVQEWDQRVLDRAKCDVVTKRKPTEDEWTALALAWTVVKHVKSNAIVYATATQTVGVGAGQMSRVDAARFGALKAVLPLAGTVAASDAFFPFRDGVDAIAKSGSTAIIQPGGSVKDEEVIAAADEHGLAMVFTGVRHFRH